MESFLNGCLSAQLCLRWPLLACPSEEKHKLSLRANNQGYVQLPGRVRKEVTSQCPKPDPFWVILCPGRLVHSHPAHPATGRSLRWSGSVRVGEMQYIKWPEQSHKSQVLALDKALRKANCQRSGGRGTFRKHQGQQLRGLGPKAFGDSQLDSEKESSTRQTSLCH